MGFAQRCRQGRPGNSYAGGGCAGGCGDGGTSEMGIPLDWAGMWVFGGCRGYDLCWFFRYPPPQAGELVNGNIASRSICESAMAIPVSRRS